MPFQFSRLQIPEVVQIERRAFADGRGQFAEIFRGSDFRAYGISGSFVQVNHSRSARGVLRGLHFQKPPGAQGKLVAVLRGEIFDVAVDIRSGSPTHGRWVGLVLSADNQRMLYIPEGFAHGFCVLGEVADVVYTVTAEHAPELEAGLIWNDRDVGIAWPVRTPILSERDARLPSLRDVNSGFVYAGAR